MKRWIVDWFLEMNFVEFGLGWTVGWLFVDYWMGMNFIPQQQPKQTNSTSLVFIEEQLNSLCVWLVDLLMNEIKWNERDWLMGRELGRKPITNNPQFMNQQSWWMYEGAALSISLQSIISFHNKRKLNFSFFVSFNNWFYEIDWMELKKYYNSN